MPLISSIAEDLSASPLLVFDGDCGACNRFIQFILRHERKHTLRFVPRNSSLGVALRHRFYVESLESMFWLDGGSILAESSAVLAAISYLGGWWRHFARLVRTIPKPLRDLAYRCFARNRYRIQRSERKCLLLTDDQTARFLLDSDE